MGCFDEFWIPQFHTFPHHWRISLAKHSPMTFTNVLENLSIAKQEVTPVFNDAEEVGN